MMDRDVSNRFTSGTVPTMSWQCSAMQCSAVQCSAVNEGSKLSEIIQEETDGVYRQIGKQKENEWKCF